MQPAGSHLVQVHALPRQPVPSQEQCQKQHGVVAFQRSRPARGAACSKEALQHWLPFVARCRRSLLQRHHVDDTTLTQPFL